MRSMKRRHNQNKLAEVYSECEEKKPFMLAEEGGAGGPWGPLRVLGAARSSRSSAAALTWLSSADDAGCDSEHVLISWRATAASI